MVEDEGVVQEIESLGRTDGVSALAGDDAGVCEVKESEDFGEGVAEGG